jgi:hypothetical protein
MKITLGAILTRFGSRADNTFSLSFQTNELTSEQIIGVNNLKNQFGFLMFKDSEIENAEKEEFDSLEADLNDPSKTPSKRLRSVFYVMWFQNNQGHETFKTYYAAKMESLIEHYKGKLE